MSMKKSDLDKQLGKKIGGQMKVAGDPGPLRPGRGRRRRPARAAPPRRRRRPGAVRVQAAGRPRRDAAREERRRAPTASTAWSPSCCEKALEVSARRRARMSDRRLASFDLFIIGAGSGGVRAGAHGGAARRARRGRRGRRARRHLRQPRLHPEEAVQLRRPLRRELRGGARLRLERRPRRRFDWEALKANRARRDRAA